MYSICIHIFFPIEISCFPTCLLFSFHRQFIPVTSVFFSSPISLLRKNAHSVGISILFSDHLSATRQSWDPSFTASPPDLLICPMCPVSGKGTPVHLIAKSWLRVIAVLGALEALGSWDRPSLTFPSASQVGSACSGHLLEWTDRASPALAPMGGIPNVSGNKSTWGCCTRNRFWKTDF